MEPVAVPEQVKRHHPSYRLVQMGPPPGVSGDDCGTAEMLIGDRPVMAGFPGRDQMVFYRPDAYDLQLLNDGGVICFNQLGTVVQPFSVGVYAGD